jgi:hypothetical protein
MFRIMTLEQRLYWPPHYHLESWTSLTMPDTLDIDAWLSERPSFDTIEEKVFHLFTTQNASSLDAINLFPLSSNHGFKHNQLLKHWVLLAQQCESKGMDTSVYNPDPNRIDWQPGPEFFPRYKDSPELIYPLSDSNFGDDEISSKSSGASNLSGETPMSSGSSTAFEEDQSDISTDARSFESLFAEDTILATTSVHDSTIVPNMIPVTPVTRAPESLVNRFLGTCQDIMAAGIRCVTGAFRWIKNHF